MLPTWPLMPGRSPSMGAHDRLDRRNSLGGRPSLPRRPPGNRDLVIEAQCGLHAAKFDACTACTVHGMWSFPDAGSREHSAPAWGAEWTHVHQSLVQQPANRARLAAVFSSMPLCAESDGSPLLSTFAYMLARKAQEGYGSDRISTLTSWSGVAKHIRELCCTVHARNDMTCNSASVAGRRLEGAPTRASSLGITVQYRGCFPRGSSACTPSRYYALDLLIHDHPHSSLAPSVLPVPTAWIFSNTDGELVPVPAVRETST
nr:hypothetical protein CFP56_21636 [Quercus suber]